MCSGQVKSAKGARKRPATDNDDDTQTKKTKLHSNQGRSIKNKKNKFIRKDSHAAKKKTPLPKKKSFDDSRNTAGVVKKSPSEGMKNSLIQD